jgi:hypothetical protein
VTPHENYRQVFLLERGAFGTGTANLGNALRLINGLLADKPKGTCSNTIAEFAVLEPVVFSKQAVRCWLMMHVGICLGYVAVC